MQGNGKNRLLVGECECGKVRYRVADEFQYAMNCVSVVRDGAFVHVALGSLVDGPSVQPTKHIFVGSKAPWFEITDDLLQFEEY